MCWIIAALVLGLIAGAAAMFLVFRNAALPPPW
jgi:hypothetical protein